MYFSGHMTTSLGEWLDQTARGWLVYSLTGSALQLGVVSAIRAVPLLLFSIVAGVFADRYGRKAQLIIAQVVNAILGLILAVLVHTGQIQVWHIYVTGFLAGIAQAFQQPARMALLNDLVGGKNLLNAVGLNNTAFNLSRSAGPAIAGIIIQNSGVAASYYTQAVFYVLATVWLLQIRVPESHLAAVRASGYVRPSFLGSIKEGFAYIVSQQMILAMIILGLSATLLGQPYTSLMPVFAVDVLHGDARTQGTLLSMSGVGALLGALIAASLGRRQGNGKLLIVTAAGFGASLVFFSQSPVLWMAMVFTFLAGLSNTSYNSQNMTIVQTIAASEFRGRVLGIQSLTRGLAPLGTLLAGILASWLGGPWAVTIMGSACVVLVLGVALVKPDIWKLNLMAGYQ